MRDKTKVLWLVPFQEADRAEIAAGLPDADITFVNMNEFTPDQAVQAEVVFGNVRPERMGEFRALRWMQLFSAGADINIDRTRMPAGMSLTTAAGVYNEAISEYLLGGALVHFLRLPKLGRNQAQHLWRGAGPARMLHGSTVLITGLGNIGGEFARKAKLLGAARVIGFRRNVGERPDGADELYTLDALNEHLGRADLVANILPHAAQTASLYDRERFARFREGRCLSTRAAARRWTSTR